MSIVTHNTQNVNPQYWSDMTDWAVRQIMDLFNHDRGFNAYDKQAKQWLHSIGVTRADDVKRIAAAPIHCRFCGAELTATRSRYLGYGQDCATREGLPY